MTPIEPMKTATVASLGLCAGLLMGVLLLATWAQLKRLARRLGRR